MATGTSKAGFASGKSFTQSSITAPLGRLRKRLQIWRVRRWIHDRPEAIQIAAGDTWRHVRLAATGRRHIHLVREANRPINWEFFRWIETRHPQIAGLFRHSTATGLLATRTKNVALLVPWVQDPVRERHPALYRRLQLLEARCERAGIPVVNRVAHLSNAIKSDALTALRDAGFTAARALRLAPNSQFDDVAAAVGLPFIARNDQGHGGLVRLVRTPADFADIDWSQLTHPVALEYLETRSTDGLYRKYRYLVTGDTGVSRHLIVSRGWCVHAEDRVHGQAIMDEELEFLEQPNPYRQQLVDAAQALKLDFVAFDYSIDQTGRLVIWEPNPFPCLWAAHYNGDPAYAYQRPCIDKVFTHVLRFYLQRAGLDIAI